MYANREQEQFAMDHYYQAPRVRPPDDFDTVVHKITVLLTWWTQMEREGLPVQEMTNLIDSMTHEPLARAATAVAMYKGFDAVADDLQTLLRLHRELQRKGFSVQGIQQAVRALEKGPLTRAVTRPESTPSKSSAFVLKH